MNHCGAEEARRRTAPDAAETAASRVRPSARAGQCAIDAAETAASRVRPGASAGQSAIGAAETAASRVRRVRQQRRELNQTRRILLWLKYQFVRQRESSR